MTAVSPLRKLGRVALDLLFPRRCAVCGSFEDFLCHQCEEGLPQAAPPRCIVCWQPHAGSGVCQRCQQESPAFEGLRSPYVFQGGARELVHALKYDHQTALATLMASLLSRYLLYGIRLPADILIPVPLYPRRKRVRGYNQSALLARELGHRVGLPVEERTLVRERNTPSQAERLSAKERRMNVAGAFAYRGQGLQGQRVLLIDDVATTGATLDACARVLRQAGAASVWALTFARED
jgi:ComF family protein